MEYWSVGGMEYWKNGMLEGWKRTSPPSACRQASLEC
jgi:hypothetical protein